MTSANTYTYGIDYNPVMGVVTRARGRKKVVQGFLSVDPLTSSYPMLTPYQFASNSPISGIDLDGLEYLDYRDARVEIRNGEAHLKLKNASNWTNNYVQGSGGIVRYRDGRDVYETEVSTYVGTVNIISAGDLNNVRQAMPTQGPSVSRYMPKPGGNAAQRRKYRRALRRDGLFPGSSNPGKPGPKVTPKGKGILSLILFSEGVDNARSMTINGDFDTADAEFDDFGKKAIDAFENSLREGLVLPDKFNTTAIKSDITNFILQGEFTGSYDQETENQLREFSVNVMRENGIPIREESLPSNNEPR